MTSTLCHCEQYTWTCGYTSFISNYNYPCIGSYRQVEAKLAHPLILLLLIMHSPIQTNVIARCSLRSKMWTVPTTNADVAYSAPVIDSTAACCYDGDDTGRNIHGDKIVDG